MVALSAILVGWSLAILVPETLEAARGRDRSPELLPRSWLLGGPQTEPLRAFLEGADRRLPRGSLVVVRTAHDAFDAHYVHMWAAYFLPRHLVVPASRQAESLRDYGNGPVYLLTYPPQEAAPAGAPLLLASDVATLHRLPRARADPVAGLRAGRGARSTHNVEPAPGESASVDPTVVDPGSPDSSSARPREGLP